MTQPPVTPNYATQRPQPGSGLAVASMILGILSVVAFCSRIAAITLGVLAIVLAVIALGQIKQGQASGGGMAKAGLVLGIIGAVISIVFYIVVVAGARKAGSFFQQKAQELQKQAEEQQRKIQEQQQNNTTQPNTQPGASTDIPLRWHLDGRGALPGRQMIVEYPHFVA